MDTIGMAGLWGIPEGEGGNGELAAHGRPSFPNLPVESPIQGLESYISLERMQELKQSIAEVLYRCVDFYVAFAIEKQSPSPN